MEKIALNAIKQTPFLQKLVGPAALWARSCSGYPKYGMLAGQEG